MNHPSSWRAFAGGLLVLLGVLLLLAALGVLGAGAAWGIFWAVVLIVAGAVVLLRRGSRSVRSVRSGAAVGEIRMGDTPWDFHDMETNMAAGQMRVDLSKARVPQGETRLKVKGGMGKIEILVPASLAISVQAEVGAGSITILGNKADGVGRQLQFVSPGYESADKKVKMDLSLMMGETLVIAAGA